MKNLLMISLFVIIGISFFVSQGFAEDKNKTWESEFVQALRKEKARIETDSKVINYASAGETVLAEAIKQAIVINNAPACKVMKIAIDLEFNPYLVIKNIFSHGGEIDLDQLCMCATEDGINKQIFAKASEDAASSLGEPIFSRYELTQSQCLREIGLGYHEPVDEMPDIVKPPPKPPQFSKSSPT